MNIIILRLHPTRCSPRDVYLVANAWYNCSIRSDMRSVFGVLPRERPSGKKRQVLYHSRPAGRTHGSRAWPSASGPPAGNCTFAKLRIRGPDPRVRSSGRPKTSRGSFSPDPRVTCISRVMTRPDPRHFKHNHIHTIVQRRVHPRQKEDGTDDDLRAYMLRV